MSYYWAAKSSNQSKPTCAPNRRVPWASPKHLKSHSTTNYWALTSTSKNVFSLHPRQPRPSCHHRPRSTATRISMDASARGVWSSMTLVNPGDGSTQEPREEWDLVGGTGGQDRRTTGAVNDLKCSALATGCERSGQDGRTGRQCVPSQHKQVNSMLPEQAQRERGSQTILMIRSITVCGLKNKSQDRCQRRLVTPSRATKAETCQKQWL